MSYSLRRLMWGVGCAAIIAWPSLAHGAIFSFPDFSDPSPFKVNNESSITNDRLRLTISANDQEGSIYLIDPVSFETDYSFTSFFAFQFADPGAGGADGMNLIIHNDARGNTALGGGGGAMGIDGITPYVAVEIDTWQDAGFHDNPANFSQSHLAIHKSGDANADVVQTDPNVVQPELADGLPHYIWVDHQSGGPIQVFYNATESIKPADPVIQRDIDFATQFAGATNLYVGFTAATGGARETHDVLSWDFATEPVDPGVLGDVDGDMDVDFADFEIIRQNFNLTGKRRAEGNLNGDRLVDFKDFQIWKAGFAAGPAPAGVPEPATLSLAGIAIVLGLVARRIVNRRGS